MAALEIKEVKVVGEGGEFVVVGWANAESECKQSGNSQDPIEPPPTPRTTPDFPITGVQNKALPDTETVNRSPVGTIPTGPGASRANLTAPSLRPFARTTSHQWLSPKEREIERFWATKTSLERTAPNSPFTPSSLHEWLAHRLAWIEDQTQAATAKLARISQGHMPRRCGPAFGGKTFPDNRSAVLGMETIWSPWKTDRPDAAWPSPAEFKWEGDSRVWSGYGRYPPIPRKRSDPENLTVAWHRKPPAETHEFDRVGLSLRVPFVESEFLMCESLIHAFLLEELLLTLGWEGVHFF